MNDERYQKSLSRQKSFRAQYNQSLSRQSSMRSIKSAADTSIIFEDQKDLMNSYIECLRELEQITENYRSEFLKNSSLSENITDLKHDLQQKEKLLKQNVTNFRKAEERAKQFKNDFDREVQKNKSLSRKLIEIDSSTRDEGNKLKKLMKDDKNNKDTIASQLKEIMHIKKLHTSLQTNFKKSEENCQKMTQENVQLKSALKAADSTVTQQKSSISHLEKSLEKYRSAPDWQTKHNQLSAKLKMTQEKLSTKEFEVEEKNSIENSLEQEIKEVRNQNEKLSTSNQELTNMLKEISEEFKILEKDYENSCQQLKSDKNLKTELFNVKNLLNIAEKDFKILQAQYENLEEEKLRLLDDKENLDTQLYKVQKSKQSETSENSEKLEKLQSQIDNLNSKNREINDENRKLNKNYSELEVNLDLLLQFKESAKNKIKELESSNEDFRLQNNNLQETVISQNKKIKVLKEEKTKIEFDMSRQNSFLHKEEVAKCEMQSQISAFTNKSSKEKTQLFNLIGDLERAELSNYTLKSEVKTLKENLAEKQETLKKKDAWIKQLKIERNYAREDFRDEISKSKAYKDRGDELQEELVSTKEFKAKLMTELKEAKIELIRLEQTKNQHKNAIEMLHIENDKLRLPFTGKSKNKHNKTKTPKKSAADKWAPPISYIELESTNLKLEKELASTKLEISHLKHELATVKDKQHKKILRASMKSRTRSQSRGRDKERRVPTKSGNSIFSSNSGNTISTLKSLVTNTGSTGSEGVFSKIESATTGATS